MKCLLEKQKLIKILENKSTKNFKLCKIAIIFIFMDPKILFSNLLNSKILKAS